MLNDQLLLLALTATLLIVACVGIVRNMATGQWHAQPVLVLGTLAVIGSVLTGLVGLSRKGGSVQSFMWDGAASTIQFMGNNFAVVAVVTCAAVIALEYLLPFALPSQASLHCLYPRWRTLTSTWPASLSQWADEETLAKPLKDFHIFSSHNSFLACAQNFTPASIEALQLNIRLGCRCIEMDAWHDEDRIIVSHATVNDADRLLKSTTSLPLEACLKAVAECAWQSSDDPLVLYMQNHKMTSLGGALLGKTVKEILGDRLAQLPEGVRLPDTPVGTLRGKVILVTNGLTGPPAADALIHATMNGDSADNFSFDSAFRQKEAVARKAETSIVRVYPDANLRTLLSGNQDMVKAMQELRAQICAINMQGADAHTEEYLRFFGQRAFVPVKKQ